MLVCDKCNWENPDYAAFCTNCGTPVGAAKKVEEERWRFSDQGAKEADLGVSDEPASSGTIEESEAEEVSSAVPSSVGESVPEEASEELSQSAFVTGSGPSTGQGPVGVAVRSARTLVDLTVPDFRAMVDMAQGEAKPEDSAPESTGLLNPPSAGQAASAETSTPAEEVSGEVDDQVEEPQDQPSPTTLDPSTQQEERSADTADTTQGRSDGPLEDTVDVSIDDDPSLVEAPAPRSPVRDLGSLDVVIEDVEGDESVDGMLLSSSDVSPIDISGFGSTNEKAPEVKASLAVGTTGVVLRCLSENGPSVVSSLGDVPVVIGRKDCELRVPKDEYVCAQHARISVANGQVQVADLDSLNGVWLRIRGEHRLTLGSQFMVGQQVFVVGAVGNEDSGRPPMSNDTRRLGASWRASKLTVSRISSNDRVVARYTVPSDGLRVGRRQGEIIISDDTYLSGIHAQLSPANSESLNLRDLSTGNGCWVRLNGTTSLRDGDTFMTGKTSWRVGRALGN